MILLLILYVKKVSGISAAWQEGRSQLLLLLLQHHELRSLSPPIPPVPAPCLSFPVVYCLYSPVWFSTISIIGRSCHESLPLPCRYVRNVIIYYHWKWQPYRFSDALILCFVAYGSYCVTGAECISMNLHNSVCTQGVCQCRPGFFYPSEPMRTNCYEGLYIVAKCSSQRLSSSSVTIFRILSE